jgi:arsenite methyltransferase
VSERPNYGIDAPRDLRKLLFRGCVCGVAGIAASFVTVQPLISLGLAPVLGWVAIGFLLPVPVMLWSSLFGKFALRDAVLDAAGLSGGESVLDVGCGRGLLLVGAARRLPHGRVFGIDLWDENDLADNSPEAALHNARLERVDRRVVVETGDARALPWRAASFDAVVSSTAIHNIKDAAGREKALSEMVRVLKPGGRLSLFDIFHPWSYRRTLEALGMAEVELKGPMLYWMVPGARVTARKPG